jgi:hypothetical protein
MLGTCWRLLTEPESLCTRVLKGPYFPDSDFLTAIQPRASSYTWRSILYGRDLLLKGIRWSVGNGLNISVFHDNWIPGLKPGTFKTIEELPTDTKAEFLLNQDLNCWDMEKVRYFFTTKMASVIQQIPVSRHGGEDFISWPHARFGNYTV